ncbi:MAG: PH domain-containing protein [Candidatus Methanoplasma sp.]|jgi:hypothetical protein|nr:PH domain-containing protein [Candidatus Methanoplasma sp.]
MGNVGEQAYGSKVGAWYYGTIVVIIAIVAFVAWAFWTTGDFEIVLIVFILGVVSVAFMIYLRRGTLYILSDKYLVIKSPGSKLEWIGYSDISNIIGCKSSISAKALSTDRVQILTHGSPTYISPVDKENFIDELKERIRTSQNDG